MQLAKLPAIKPRIEIPIAASPRRSSFLRARRILLRYAQARVKHELTHFQLHKAVAACRILPHTT
jgi:hypothetical protein